MRDSVGRRGAGPARKPYRSNLEPKLRRCRHGRHARNGTPPGTPRHSWSLGNRQNMVWLSIKERRAGGQAGLAGTQVDRQEDGLAAGSRWPRARATTPAAPPRLPFCLFKGWKRTARLCNAQPASRAVRPARCYPCHAAVSQPEDDLLTKSTTLSLSRCSRAGPGPGRGQPSQPVGSWSRRCAAPRCSGVPRGPAQPPRSLRAAPNRSRLFPEISGVVRGQATDSLLLLGMGSSTVLH